MLLITKALNPYSKAFTYTQSHSEGLHTHSKLSYALNQVQGVFTLTLRQMQTQLCSRDVHTHSKGSWALNSVQGVLILTKGIHTHSSIFQGCSTWFNTHSKGVIPQMPNGYVLKSACTEALLIYSKVKLDTFQSSIEFQLYGFTKR